jgi:arylsulfatase A-like enzyme
MTNRLLALALLAAPGCSGSGATASTALPDATGTAPSDADTPAPANIVFVLTDDLAWNLVRFMPHVLQMQQQGTTFTHYYVTDSLCCPSRSSIFTGKYPHDTTVFTNTGAHGGYAKFESAGNATQTYAVTLGAAGYRTAMMGKYLNGYDPTINQADPGWLEWEVAGNGYPEFNYKLNQNGTATSYGATPSDYLTDVLSGLAVNFVRDSGPHPFVIEVAAFAPHAPYTPAPRDVGTFHEAVPRTPAFDTANTNPPMWLAMHAPLAPADLQALDTAFNLRVEAVQAVDQMIATLLATLAASGLDQSTYVVFSSDNGYHMGEHMLHAGKMTAFDSDINVPLIVVGPGVPAGATVDAIVENIDLCPTFAEIAGVAAPATTDGHSLLGLLHGQPATDWREAALIEHKGPDLQPPDPTDPDNEPAPGPMPNSYEAIRMASSVYVEYQDGETEYYDLATDPDEMTNTSAALKPTQVQTFHRTLVAIKNCHDAASCWAAQKLAR